MVQITAGIRTSLDFRNPEAVSWNYLTFSSRQQGYARADLRFLGDSSYAVEFFGSDFQYDAFGVPARGTVSGFQESRGGVTTLKVEGLAMPVSQLLGGSWHGMSEAARALLLAENDILTGSPLDDYVSAYAGNDVLRLGAGNDTALPGPGDDVVDGGPGLDTVVLNGRAAEYRLVAWDGILATIPLTAAALALEGSDRLTGIERLQFTSGEIRPATGESFAPLAYIAANPDLIRALGADAAAGFEHYTHIGAREGRPVAFRGAEYLASHGDLQLNLGIDVQAAVTHYIRHGHAERRGITFDGLEYIASYTDLMDAYGTDREAGALHRMLHGWIEGRAARFESLEYTASYPDLILAFGSNQERAAAHYIGQGRQEGRTVLFDALDYIASHGDLIQALGANREAGSLHYLQFGRFEGRKASFDAAQYLTNYIDLQLALGTDQDAAARHYILHGFQEGRTDDILG